jgi:hypothetical protein
MAFYDEAVGRIVQKSGMRPFEACSQAAELTSAVYRTIYQQIDPNRLAESARGLEIGCEYGIRVLRRYRPDLLAKVSTEVIHRLVHAYPSHGFVVDLEELAELGLPARAAEDGGERDALDALAEAIIEAPEDATLIELVLPAAAGDDGERPADIADLEDDDAAAWAGVNGAGRDSHLGPRPASQVAGHWRSA